MKGFPNQVSKIPILTSALVVIRQLLADGKNPRDDGVLGEALIRQGVLGTGHVQIPVDEYMRQQHSIPKRSNQSYRTRARGLRELFRVMGLIEGDDTISLTRFGRLIADAHAGPRDQNFLRLWRSAILDMTHDGGDGVSSHPYQVLLRLVASRPGITRAKCALALEAKDDSEEELDRIAELSDLGESAIRGRIRVSKPNWDNAKKILPGFAEQLGDVLKIGQSFTLTQLPGETVEIIERPDEEASEPQTTPRVRASRRPSPVTPETIATTRVEAEFDESLEARTVEIVNPSARRTHQARLTERFNRHQAIVQRAASLLASKNGELFEAPFDCLALFAPEALLVEVKSLDGTASDEVDRVREALSQLLYYEAFATQALTENRPIRKVACFESQITDGHVAWLEASDIRVIWCEEDGDGFKANPATTISLSGYFDLE